MFSSGMKLASMVSKKVPGLDGLIDDDEELETDMTEEILKPK
jgi:hypothetical protein